MIIGFDAKRAFNNRRGLGNYSRDTIRIVSSQFAENQHFLFTPKISRDIPFTPNANCEVVMPTSFCARRLPALWRTFGLARLADDLHLDIYHGLSHELPVGIRKSRARSVVTMHDLIFLKFPELYPLIDRKLYQAKYLRSCEVADHIVAISEQTRQDLVELAHIDPQKITVVYQGCNPRFTRPATEAMKAQVREKYRLPQQFMLSVGALEERKNHLLILQAMVCGKIDLPLVIVGVSTDYAETISRFIADNRLESRVMILSGVPGEELPAIYQCASLFVYPSLFEGFGIPILEAMHSRLPVIAATGSCLEESGGEGSIYVSPHNAEELAFQINKVLNDSELRRDMLQKSTLHLQKFSEEAIARNMMSVYQKVLR